MIKYKSIVLTALLAITGATMAAQVADLGDGTSYTGKTLTFSYQGHLDSSKAYSLDCKLDSTYLTKHELGIHESNFDPAAWGDVTLDGKDTSGKVVLTPGSHVFHAWRISLLEKNIKFDNYDQPGDPFGYVHVSCTATEQP